MIEKVSVVLPTLNEQAYIRDCLDSLLNQEGDLIGEIIVVDGRSNDETVAIALEKSDVIRVVDNPEITAASAMNRGIRAATHEVIVRADAHTIYAPDYVLRSVEALESSGADVVGGPMRPVGTTRFGRAVASVTSSPFGIGPGRFHFSDRAQDVETVYLGTFRRAIVEEIGGYDTEHLQWAAEDQELNYRLRMAGRRIRLDPTIRSTYFPRATPRALWRQYYNYGICKASTLKKHRRLPYLRPLAPAALVLILLSSIPASLLKRRPLLGLIPIGSYVAATGAIAVRLSNEPGLRPHRNWLALLICHMSYGLGFWNGIGRIVSGRPFDTRPRRAR